MKGKNVIPFEEWKSRLLCRGYGENRSGTVQHAAWEIDGDREQYMFTETTIFPHFGQVMAQAIDPEHHNYPNKAYYSMGYVDPTGNCALAFDDEYSKELPEPTEVFPTFSFARGYPQWELNGSMNDYDKACEVAYEMYRRRRLPTSADMKEDRNANP